ncbi:MAG: hypothetical protein ACJ8EL_17520 [Rhizomicrobium sp.]
MRALISAIVLVSSSVLTPAFAQDQGNSSPRAQTQITPVQPERSPQQSEQSREQDRKSAEDVQVGRDWKAQQRDGDRMGRMGRMGQNNMGRMMDQDEDHRTVGRNWRTHRDDDEGYYDQDRARPRVKICTEYENGDEFCRYRN